MCVCMDGWMDMCVSVCVCVCVCVCVSGADPDQFPPFYGKQSDFWNLLLEASLSKSGQEKMLEIGRLW